MRIFFATHAHHRLFAARKAAVNAYRSDMVEQAVNADGTRRLDRV